MSLLGFIVHTLGYGAALLLDMLALLMVIRVLCDWHSIPILASFNEAGRPLVDRAVTCLTQVWRRLVPHRMLSPHRGLILALLVVTALRFCLGVVVSVAVRAS